jgi:hypothetical protein
VTGIRAFCELSDDGKKVEVHFPYNPEAIRALKGDSNGNGGVPGRRFVPREEGGPYWTIPKDLTSCELLREAFGVGLRLGDAVSAWAREERNKERNLSQLVTANDAELEIVPKVAPLIARAIDGEDLSDELPHLPRDHALCSPRDPRPYQRADIKAMSMQNMGNFNQPGTGKTLEWLGAVVEADLLYKGIHLVCAPVRSLENVWLQELDNFMPDDVHMFTAEDPLKRKLEVVEGIEAWEQGAKSVWICVNPDFLRLKKIWDRRRDAGKDQPPRELWARKDRKGNIYGWKTPLQKRLMQRKFASFNIDEFHKAGMGNPDTLFRLSIDLIDAKLKCPMSGTPMGGKPIRLFPVLQYIHPDKFTSKWRWAEQWLQIEEDESSGHKDIGNLDPDREDKFYSHHAQYMIRRLKREALPGLPPKQHEVVMCKMTPKQRKQYDEFERMAEIKIEEERLSATNVLAEYARLKQFANAVCTVESYTKINRKTGEDEVKLIVKPTTDSGKLPQLLEKLEENGVRKEDPEPEARAIVASESKRMVNMVASWLESQGFEVGLMTGDTDDIGPIIRRFQSNDEKPYIICMTTTTGGVSLNLEKAGSVHILDETWNPDDQEQLEDRGDRGARTTPLICYYYRSKESIQEYIAQITAGKAITNKNILDVRRQMYQLQEAA